MEFVLDASIAVCWFLKSQQTTYSLSVMRGLLGSVVHVPAVWAFEIATVMRKEQNLGNLTFDDSDRFFKLIRSINVKTSAPASPESLVASALVHHLKPADASYVELAFALKVPLASADEKMCAAALRAGVPLLAP
jgi:predicted nucleic acid-binding protein